MLNIISDLIKKQLDNISITAVPGTEYRFMIEVPNKNYEFDGNDNFNDGKPLRIGDKFYLVTIGEYHNDPSGNYWSGIHVQDEKLSVDINGLIDRSFCKLKLPVGNILKTADKMPGATFTFRAITDADKGHTLEANGWKLTSGLDMVDTTLLVQQ